ncbi:MAG: hypothetical protein FWC89_10460 [Defluviitaleaceae bacterium]|nr:hypothetical protein [Defluviitaleaceae bacterium]
MIFWYELKKILSGIALWVFVLLCIAFNIWSMPRHFGGVPDTTTPFPINVFEGYNASTIAEDYIRVLRLTGGVADGMRAKYAALQEAIDARAIAEDSYSPYFGEYSFRMHQNLFHRISIGGVMGRLLLQGVAIAVLLTLLCLGYEQINGTELNVYATKTGRRVLRHKIAASLVAGVGLYALLTAVTLAVYFNAFDYSDVWGSSVSSGFNFIDSVTGARPFITWFSFTVASFLLAFIGVSAWLVVCFALMGVVVGLFSRNSYIAFLMVLVVNAVCFVLPAVFSINSYGRYFAFHSPIWLWWNSGWWFTDGGPVTLWRNFELWGTGISFFVLATICVFAVKKFEKRDIT